MYYYSLKLHTNFADRYYEILKACRRKLQNFLPWGIYAYIHICICVDVGQIGLEFIMFRFAKTVLRLDIGGRCNHGQYHLNNV